jgi:membrane protein
LASTRTEAHAGSGLASRLTRWLWDERPAPSVGVRALRTATQFAYALGKDLVGGELSLRAASLVYTSILSVVPLLALSFSVLKGLDLHHRLEPLLLSFLSPLGPQAPQLADRVIGFVDNVQGSVLAGVSLGLLLVTTVSMAQKVEASFNFVWRITKSRSLVRRVTDYLSLILAGPVVMSVSIGLIAALMNTGFITRLRAVAPFGSVLALLGQLLPYVLVIACFAFLYAFVPNTRVRLGPAIAGGIFGGSLWVAAGYLFTAFIGASGRAEAIYSGFAAVIAAMLWLYVSWLVLLLGAQLAFYAQSPLWLRYAAPSGSVSARHHERLTLAAMLWVARRFAIGAPAPDSERLATHLGVPRHVLEPALAALERARLLLRTDKGELVPARDLCRIRVRDIVNAARGPRAADWIAPEGEAEPLGTVTARIEAGIASSVGEDTLADMLRQEAPQEAPSERASPE